MACVLKVPADGSKGVLVLTTQERDRLVHADPALAAAIETRKDRWVIGLHHNWHDHAFVRDPLFDFSMAGPGDLVGDDVPLVTLDACNFVPPEFAPGGQAFWDVLVVGRPVFFKGFPRLFDTVRTLYDGGHELRVLCICPMPPYAKEDRDTVMYDLREVYEERFSAAERRLFNLLVIEHDYPFPLDLPTLAHFYRSSRAFVHFAPDERRCRVAAYAWAAGLPVVGTAAVGSLLPDELRRPPAFHEVADDGDYAGPLLEALAAGGSEEARAWFGAERTRADLRSQLDAHFPGAGLGEDTGYAWAGLDIRLGRHHGIGDPGPNRVPMELRELVARLDEVSVDERDPERALAGGAQESAAEEPQRRRRGLRRVR